MERTQAEAIAQTVMAPDLAAQENTRQKRATEAAELQRKRGVAWLALGGCVIGVGVAWSSGTSLALGVVWGGLAGAALGWMTLRRPA